MQYYALASGARNGIRNSLLFPFVNICTVSDTFFGLKSVNQDFSRYKILPDPKDQNWSKQLFFKNPSKQGLRSIRSVKIAYRENLLFTMKKSGLKFLHLF